MKSDAKLVVDVAQRVATLCLNRPEHDNALDAELLMQLKDALIAAETDPRIKVVVIQGAGNVFCSGLDVHHLHDMQARGLDDQLAEHALLADVFLRIHRHKKPVIAQVQGAALGSGCTLALMCDFVLAASDATMGYSDVQWGFVPALEAALLPTRLGPAVTRRLLLGGNTLQGTEAQAAGLVDEVLPAAELETRTAQLAAHICQRHSPGTLELLKRLLADVPGMPAADALGFVARIGAHSRKTVEFEIGIQARMDNKPVEW